MEKTNTPEQRMMHRLFLKGFEYLVELALTARRSRLESRSGFFKYYELPEALKDQLPGIDLEDIEEVATLFARRMTHCEFMVSPENFERFITAILDTQQRRRRGDHMVRMGASREQLWRLFAMDKAEVTKRRMTLEGVMSAQGKLNKEQRQDIIDESMRLPDALTEEERLITLHQRTGCSIAGIGRVLDEWASLALETQPKRERSTAKQRVVSLTPRYVDVRSAMAAS